MYTKKRTAFAMLVCGCVGILERKNRPSMADTHTTNRHTSAGTGGASSPRMADTVRLGAAVSAAPLISTEAAAADAAASSADVGATPAPEAAAVARSTYSAYERGTRPADLGATPCNKTSKSNWFQRRRSSIQQPLFPIPTHTHRDAGR